MKVFGRTVKDNGSWVLWCGPRSLPIVGDVSCLIHGGLVMFSSSLLKKKISAQNLVTYAQPEKDFIIPRKDWSLKTLFKNRVEHLRSPQGKILLEVKSSTLQSIRKHFINNKFIEVTTPTLISSVSEGRVSRFNVKFKNEDMFLAMTFLPYLNLLCYTDSNKVFQVANVFQSGQSNTASQVNEYLVFDWARVSFNKNIQEEINFINKALLEAIRAFNRLKFITKSDSLPVADFKNIPLISYDTVIREMTAEGLSIEDHNHIPPSVFEVISGKYKNLFWIYNFPKMLKPFYCHTSQSGEQEFVDSAELWWNGFKIATTSLTQNSLDKQKERIKYLGFDLADYDFYLNTIASGVLPTFVSTINFERFIAKMLNFKTVKEAVLFPRATRNTSNKP